MTSSSPAPIWRVLARLDFVAAVALTVLAPLALLARAVRASRAGELRALLRYWRASSLLMVSVYLLIGERRAAFPAGIAARLLLAQLLLGPGGARGDEDLWFTRWRRAAGGYCLAGAALSAPLLRGCLAAELPPVCRAYIEPAQEFGALLHQGVSRERLGRVGDAGLGLFLLGAVAEALADRRR